MADVYGFNASDSEALISMIGTGDSVRRLGGGSGGSATLYRFQLNANYNTGTTVGATIKTMGGTTVTSSGVLSDPEAIFFGLPSGSKGYCILQDGTYYAIQALCPAEEGYV